MDMCLNCTETTKDSASKASPNSLFYCTERENFKWIFNEDGHNYSWNILVIIRSVASPCIVLLNTLAIITMQNTNILRKKWTILLSSMAVTDLLIGVLDIPATVTVDVLIVYRVSFPYICHLDWASFCLSNILLACSVYHLTAIALERYVAIRRWIDYQVIARRSCLRKLALATWLWTIFTACPAFIMQDLRVSRNAVKAWMLSELVVITGCLILILYFYLVVLLEVRKSKIADIRRFNVLITKKAEYKIATTTALLSFVAFFSFLPAGTAFIFVDIFPVIQTNQYFIFRSTQSLAQLNSLLNPILYCFRNPQFWKVLKEMVGIKGNTDFQPWLKRTRHNQEKITNYSLKDKRRVEKHKNLSKSKSFSEGFLSDPNRKMEMLPRRSLSYPIPRCEARATFIDGQKQQARWYSLKEIRFTKR